MDINRSRTRPSSPPKAIDGFFLRSNGNAYRPAPSMARRSARRTETASWTPQGQRRVDDFARIDGFHAAPRRNVNMGPEVHRPGVSPRSTTGRMGGAGRVESTLGKTAAKHVRRRPAVKKSKTRSTLKWAFRSTAVLLILIIAVGGILFGKGYLKLKKVFDGSSSAAALQADVDPTLLKGEGDGRVNVLLLGVGGADHSGGDLTDTMIVASVDPINNQAVLFSVPRDLWTKMPNNYVASYQKINAAYESGKYKYLGKQDASNSNKKAIQAGFQAADSTVERVLGVPIHYNALIDFQAFRQAVDTVGGVTVNAPGQLNDPTMAWENGWNPILAKAGPNSFDGKHALNYVRSRETSSDFARSQRQRAVMLALKDKVMTMNTLSNPMKLSNLLSDFGDNVQTDISISDMTRMASIMKKIPNNQIQSVGLADPPNNFLTTGNINGLSVVEPRAGLEDYSKIQTFVRSKLKDGYITKENAKVTVLNGTVTPGLATEKADELKSYGYNVGTVDNAPTTEYTNTIIVDLTKQTNGVSSKKYTLNYLKNRYHVQSVTHQLPTGIVQGAADIVIILGTDASTTL